MAISNADVLLFIYGGSLTGDQMARELGHPADAWRNERQAAMKRDVYKASFSACSPDVFAQIDALLSTFEPKAAQIRSLVERGALANVRISCYISGIADMIDVDRRMIEFCVSSGATVTLYLSPEYDQDEDSALPD